MKIVIDLTSLADNFSGIERYAACITLALLQDMDDEFVLIFKEQVHSMFQEVIMHDNVKCEILPRCNKLIFNQVKLPMLLHRIRADIFLFLAFPVPILTMKRYMVSTIHDLCCWDCPDTMKTWSKWYFRVSQWIAVHKCKRIVTISEFSKQRIVELLHCPESKIIMAYCGVDDTFRIQRNTNMENRWKVIREQYGLPERYILSLSTLEPRKNLGLLIEAYVELVKEGNDLPPLVLVGRNGWKMESFYSGIDKTIRGKIIFTGFVEDETIPYLYAMAEFFVFPSQYEGFGIPPLEAMAASTPVLASDATSIPEILGNAAMYFTNNRKESLKVQLLKMYNLMPGERKKLVEIGRKRAGCFMWKREAMHLLNEIRGTIE